jgi:hypothetical protein
MHPWWLRIRRSTSVVHSVRHWHHVPPLGMNATTGRILRHNARHPLVLNCAEHPRNIDTYQDTHIDIVAKMLRINYGQTAAMPLLHRLRLAQKFIILGLIALIMVLVPTGLYFKNSQAEVAFAHREAMATDAVVAMNAVVQFVQAHRGLSAGALAGNDALAQRRPAVSEKVAKNMAALDSALRAISASPQIMTPWNDVRQRWTTLEQGVNSKQLTSAESTKTHSLLIASALSAPGSESVATGQRRNCPGQQRPLRPHRAAGQCHGRNVRQHGASSAPPSNKTPTAPARPTSWP